MAGPVWRKTEGETATCDTCLGEGSRFMAEGKIVDGEIIIMRRLCAACYEKNRVLITGSRQGEQAAGH